MTFGVKCQQSGARTPIVAQKDLYLHHSGVNRDKTQKYRVKSGLNLKDTKRFYSL